MNIRDIITKALDQVETPEPSAQKPITFTYSNPPTSYREVEVRGVTFKVGEAVFIVGMMEDWIYLNVDNQLKLHQEPIAQLCERLDVFNLYDFFGHTFHALVQSEADAVTVLSCMLKHRGPDEPPMLSGHGYNSDTDSSHE